MPGRAALAWVGLVGLALATRGWNAWTGPLVHGYDAVGHLAYVFFLDLYRAVPFADQGWSYFHPPLHYAIGWALAQWSDAEVLVRGLTLWNGLASLGIAVASARIVAVRFPAAPGLAGLGFAVVAFLPVLVYGSVTPGNEMTAVLLSTLALMLFLEGGDALGPRRAVATGALLGLALLAKYSAAIPALAVATTLGVTALRAPTTVQSRQALGRLALILGIAGLVAGPYYLRNAAEFGTPFPLAGHRPVVDAFEAGQPPGARGLGDLVRISPALFRDPDPRAPHLLHSIWGTTYASLWVHEDPEQSGLTLGKARSLLVLGLLPTALALVGAGLVAGRAWRREAGRAELLLLLLTAGGLAAYVSFAYRTPTFAALKALYLTNLAPAWALFLATAVDRVAAGRVRAALATGAALATLVAGLLYTRGLSLPAVPETLQMTAVREHFGEWSEARVVYGRALDETLAGDAALNPLWLRAMAAALELESGDSRAASGLYLENLERRLASGRTPSAFSRGRLAAALALSGDREQARRVLAPALGEGAPPELRATAAALRAAAGDREGAVRDLDRLLEVQPELAAAWASRAALARAAGDVDAAALAAKADLAARRAPRGYPYGVGDGRGLNTQRFMLVWQPEGLALYRPARSRRGP